MACSVAIPAAIAIRFPEVGPNRPATPFASACFMVFLEPPHAARGRPPPSMVPNTVRSGVTPQSAAAPPGATRSPVNASSKMSKAPWASQRVRSVFKKRSTGGVSPVLTPTGSITTAAMLGPCSRNSRWAASTPLYGSVKLDEGSPPPKGYPSNVTVTSRPV